MIAVVVSLLLLAATIANAILWRRALRSMWHWRDEAHRQINIGAAQYERLCATLDKLAAAEADAAHLAVCVREYLKQMDEYSMRLGETPCALKRERTALSLHDQRINPPKPCPPDQSSSLSSTAPSSNSSPTPTLPSPKSVVL